jgi:uncharacterized protein (DUF433 family)
MIENIEPRSNQPKIYRYLAERAGSSYRELFVCGSALRAQSLVSDMENSGMTPAEAASEFRIPLDAVREALEYVHQNEEYLAGERRRSREKAIASGYLKPAE